MIDKSFSSGFFQKTVKVLILCVLSFGLSVNILAADDIQNSYQQDTKRLLKQAKKLHRQGENLEAEKILRQIIARHPQHNQAKLDLAYILLKDKRLVEAYDFAFEVANSDKNNSYAFAILGATYLSAGNFTDARLLLNNALSLNKKEALAWASMGMLEFYENRADDSIRWLREAVFLDSREPDFIFALAQVSARSEKYKEAADAYEKFLRIASDNDQERKDRIRGLIRFLRYLGKKSSLYDLAGEKETVVPIKIVNNRPVIQLQFKKNGEILNFVLDTGSGISVISEKTAERLKIKSITKGGVARALGGDGKFDIVYGFLDTIRIGEVKIRNVPIYIREFHNKKEDIDGYIGISLISKYITTLDYGNKTFKLSRKERDNEDLPAVNDDEKSVPLRLTSSGFLSGQVNLEGFESSLNFIVDTGASVSVISEELADSKQLKDYVLDQKMNVIGAAGITENVPSFQLPGLTFAGFSRTSLTAIALDLNLINEASGFEQSGILGGNFLKNYSLTFDFEKSMVTFVPNTKK
jgi:tetratricopeptide (TPR) repeat protein